MGVGEVDIYMENQFLHFHVAIITLAKSLVAILCQNQKYFIVEIEMVFYCSVFSKQ